MLEFAILGLLKERPMHGYDLRKRLRDEFGALEHLSFGSLYPALGRLEGSGEIRTVAAPSDLQVTTSVPFTGSIGGERQATVARRATAAAAAALGGRGTRAKKIYEITASGEALFERLLETPGTNDDTRSFTIRLAFARHLSPPALVRLLERQREELQLRLERARRAVREPVRSLDTYERAIAEHVHDTLAAEISWVDDLLAQERSTDASAPMNSRRANQDRGTTRLPAAAGSTLTMGGTR